MKYLKFVLLVILIFPLFGSGQELLEMPKATHTVEGVPCAKLKVFKEIACDFNDDLFFILPWRLAVGNADKKGHFLFYVYDAKLAKIFVFNEKFKYVSQFLGHGIGPGEVLTNSAGNKQIYAADNGNLYVSEPFGNKIIQFSSEGKYIKDIKLKFDMRADRPFLPVVDRDGFFYIYSKSDGIVDQLDEKMNLVHTYLDKGLLQKYIIFKPNYNGLYKKDHPYPIYANDKNAIYDITSDNHLFLYLNRSSTVFLFKDKKLVRKFDILIDEVLPLYRERAQKAIEDQKKIGPRIVRDEIMFSNCFVDQDQPYFYLTFRRPDKTKVMYKFNLNGKLVQFFDNINGGIMVKKHGLFFGRAFGTEDGRIVVLKKEDSL